VAVECDAPNLIAIAFGKPEIAVEAGRNRNSCCSWRGNRKFGDGAGRGDTPNPIPIVFGEPEVAVGAGDDAERTAPGRELGDVATGCDVSNHVGSPFGEPEVAVGAWCDESREIKSSRDIELGESATRSNAPKLVRTVFC
jgi:hypothetical protein